MGSDGLILKVISTGCSSAALGLFVYWLIAKVGASYSSGRELVQNLNTSGTSTPLDWMPLSSKVNHLTVAMLPTIQSWRKEQRFGITAYLTNWDHKLIQAGLRARLSPDQFLALSILAALAAGSGLAIFFLLLGSGLAGALVFGFSPAALAGFFVPGFVLKNAIETRVSFIEKRLPFAIEFMLLAMEARSAFQAAIEIYCEQLGNDPLGEEFGMVLTDMRLGMSTQEALNSMAFRIGSDDVSNFVVAVNTGIDTGQPIKDVLSVQSQVTRLRRYQAAETIAKTASTKAIFPLFLVAIAVLILLIGPLILKVADNNLF